MEIKQKEKRSRRRGRFIMILALSCVALVVAIWQYHKLIVEVSDGISTDLYQDVLHRFKDKNSLSGASLRVALLQSEYTASSFGEKRDNYYRLMKVWERLMTHEGFGYNLVTDIPQGEEISKYNLLVLPSASCLSETQRRAIKSFLKAGKGVVMTWACGTRNEYGRWEKYSLLQEIGGMDIVGNPAVNGKDTCMAMLAGGYPITSSLAAGFRLDVTTYNQPISCYVREPRVIVDGVWMEKKVSFGLHSVRDRVAVTHGDYLGGRFVWMGFSIDSCRETSVQRTAFFGLVKNSMLWAGHQVQAFKPVWQGEKHSVVSVTQNIYGPDDVNPRLMAVLRKHRVSITSFVVPAVCNKYPKLVELLASSGEIGVLGDPKIDYRVLSLSEQKKAFSDARAKIEQLTGRAPRGFRIAQGRGFSNSTLDALVRCGYEYFSTEKFDRLVPKAVRSYRKVAVVTAPHLLWQVPDVPYKISDDENAPSGNSMLSAFAQINALNGLYCLSFRPSQMDASFVDRLDKLLLQVKRSKADLLACHDVISVWSGWDQVKMSTRHVSASRTSLKISNTGRHTVSDIVMYIELPRITSSLDISSMTLGTKLPDRTSHDGVRWKLYLDKLSGGKNVTYYLDLPQNDTLPGTIAPAATKRTD